jgi:hypothetical protein
MGTEGNDNFIVDCSGSVVITGNGGFDEFTIVRNANTNTTITDFDPDGDVINLSEMEGIGGMGDLRITLGSVVIDLGMSQFVVLLGLTPGDVGERNFVFGGGVEVRSEEGERNEGSVGMVASCVVVMAVLVVGMVGWGRYARRNDVWPFRKVRRPVTELGVESSMEDVCEFFKYDPDSFEFNTMHELTELVWSGRRGEVLHALRQLRRYPDLSNQCSCFRMGVLLDDRREDEEVRRAAVEALKVI